LTEETISGFLNISNPNFNYSGNSVDASISISSSDMKKTSGYESSKTGFSLGTGFEQYEGVFLSPGFSASYEDIEVESSSSSAVKKMDGTYYNLDFDYGITWDKRNQPFQPTSGYITKFEQSLPLIIDKSSIFNGFTASKYHSFGEDIIGSVKFMARSIHGLEDEDVRLTSRLFIPQSRLRGFNSFKIGPKDGEDYIGGNYISSLNFEAQLPKILPESSRTDISIFTDFGNIWGVDYNSSINDTNTIRSSVGVAANIWTPVGPLSFVVAEDLSKALNDETQTFNFRIGTSF
jgi:outer membrane protein insertion porin family